MDRLLISSRNIYINTEDETTGPDPRNVILNLPSGVMDCGNDQHMRCTLSSFAVRVQWNRINAYNNVFFIVAIGADGVFRKTPIVIPEGNYQSWTSAPVVANGENIGLCC